MHSTRRLNIPLIVAAGILAVGCSSGSGSIETAPGGSDAAPQGAGGPVVAVETITADEMLSHIEYLASDELAGRDTPSPGLEEAARYLSEQFASYGLEPGGDSQSFIQRWRYENVSLVAEGIRVAFSGPGGAGELMYAEDFFLLPTAVETASAAAVFVGIAESVTEGFPSAAKGRVAFLAVFELGMSMFSLVDAAAEAGAVGLVLVLPPQLPPGAMESIAAQVSSGLPILTAIPVIGITYDRAQDIFQSGTGVPPALLATPFGADGASPDGAGELPRILADIEVSFDVGLNRDVSEPPNVVAIVRGSDPELRDTYLVYSAHFDHVGIGDPVDGDSIYNGADDDASGTSVLLEVAQAFAALPVAPARSIVFLAVSGEEKGLLGSKHFAENPTVPIESIIANINMDMIGRNAPDTLIAIGQEYSSLGALAHRVAETWPELGLVVAPDPDPAERAFFRSDHVNFVKADIPSIFFTTWDHEDYHKPSDHADRIDSDKAARVARFSFLMGYEIADDPVPPSWNEGSLEEVRRILAASPF